MKKILLSMFVVGMCLALVACSKKEEVTQEPNAGLANPMVEYGSLEEINNKVGCSLVKPSVMGVGEEKFFVVSDVLADYRFELNGQEYCFRASKDLSEDISGIHVGEGTMFNGEATGLDFYTENPYKGARFVVDKVQYTFTTKDEGKIDLETFCNIANEMYSVVCQSASSEDVNSLVGEYLDSTSQRAQAKVSLVDKDALLITIHWSNSADNHDEWTIKAKFEDSKLKYGMGEIDHRIITTKEDGSSSFVQVDDAIPGYFEVIDGKILWTGSRVEETESCACEKVQ